MFVIKIRLLSLLQISLRNFMPYWEAWNISFSSVLQVSPFLAHASLFLCNSMETWINLSVSLMNVQYVKRKKKKRNNNTYFNTNYRTEMKLMPIIMDYCLLQFDILQFLLEVRLHGESLPNFNLFNVNPQIFSTKS